MFYSNKRKTSLSRKWKRKNLRLWKVRQFCKFWQPILAFITTILFFLINLIL